MATDDNSPVADVEETVTVELEKADLIRLFVGIKAPAVDTPYTKREGIIGGNLRGEWREDALERMSINELMALYAEMAWSDEPSSMIEAGQAAGLQAIAVPVKH